MAFSAILKINIDGFKVNVRDADIKLAPFPVRGKLYHFGRVNGGGGGGGARWQNLGCRADFFCACKWGFKRGQMKRYLQKTCWF